MNADPRPRPPDRDAAESRVVLSFEPTRYCEKCGSYRLALIDYGGGYWRKECEDCRSTGPFPLAQTHSGATRVW